MLENSALRRALKELGYTNQSLADELTAVRTGGKATSPATVSRWVSGATSVEPALVLHLKERLAQRLAESKPRLDRARRIGIGGGKGGSGASTVAAALAVAARSLGYRVALTETAPGCNGLVRARGSMDRDWVIASDQQIDETSFDLILTDIQSETFISRRPIELSPTLSEQDLLVVTCDMSGLGGHVAFKACNVLDNLPDCPPWAILQVCDHLLLPEFLDEAARFERKRGLNTLLTLRALCFPARR